MAPLPGGMNGAQHAVVGPGPSRRRLRQRRLETLFGGGAGREPAHRAPAPRGPLARRHLANADRGDLPSRGQPERRPGGRRPVCRDRRRRRRRHGDAPLRRRGRRHARRHVRRDPLLRPRCGGRPRPRRSKATAARSRSCCRRSVPSPPISPPTTCPARPLYGRPLPDIDGLLSRRDLAGAYARVLDDALTRKRPRRSARPSRGWWPRTQGKRAGWLPRSFFNTIAHRAGLFQAAAHNVPSAALPVPSLAKSGCRPRTPP